MTDPARLLAEANMGDIGRAFFFVYLALFVVWLLVAAAMITAIASWVARRHRQRTGAAAVGRAMRAASLWGLAAAIIAAIATVPLMNAYGPALAFGFPMLACGLGSWVGAVRATEGTQGSLMSGMLLLLLLILCIPVSRYALYARYELPPVDEAIQRIREGDETVLQHLPYYREHRPMIAAALIESLDRFAGGQRSEAIVVLAELGAGDKQVTAFLLSLVEDTAKNPRPGDAAAAIRALRFQSPNFENPALIPALLRAVESEEPLVRQQAISTLEELRPPLEKVVPGLLEIYGRSTAENRSSIERLLRILDREGKVVVPALRAQLDNYPADVRADAEKLLSSYGPAVSRPGSAK